MTYYTPLIILVWLSLAILCVLAKENDRLSKEKKHILYFTYTIVAAAALSEWLGVQLNGNTAVSSLWLRIVKLFDYILTPLAGGAIILQFQTKSIWRKAIFTVLIVNTVFQTVSFFTGWMISINAENRYSHGNGYNVYIVFYLVITFLVILDFAVYGRKFRKQNRFSLFSIMFFAIAGILIQEIMGGEVRTAYVSITICLSLLFIHNSEYAQLASDDRLHEQTMRISIDPLTGILSRYAYNAEIQELNSLPSLPRDLVVFSIDVNGLKTVNDSLGHIAGDELICGASDCISSVFTRFGKCFRTGGDEFIVFARIEKEKINELTCLIAEKAEAWHGKEVTSLSLAVGNAVADEHPDVSLEKLITAADQEMYKAKNDYYMNEGINRRRS